MTTVVGDRLDALRGDARQRRVGTLLAVAVGLAAVSVHWVGFVLGGALVALVQPTVRRGLLAGLGFGVLSWVAFLAWLAAVGSLGLYLGMGQVFVVSAAIPPAGALLGSLARGVR
ncbi:MAG: hypothetical protein ABEJ30_08925 [Halorientalis sp.]